MMNSRIPFGRNAEGTTCVIGKAQHGITRIFVEGRDQFAANEFNSVLHKFGTVSEIRNRDFQEGIQEIFSGKEFP